MRTIAEVGTEDVLCSEPNVIGLDPHEKIEEMSVGIVDVNNLATLKIDVKGLETAMVAEMPEGREQSLVNDETAVLSGAEMPVQARQAIVEATGEVADEAGIDGSDHLQKFPDRDEAELAPIIGPDGAMTHAAAAEVEFVLGVEYGTT